MSAATSQPAQRTTRRPTGLPSWPILLLAGAEKAGKSWAAAVASGSQLIGRTLWLSLGEDDPDEYGAIPGTNFEIVQHDGTYRDFLAAADWAADQTSPDGRPVMLVIDSGSCLWDLICDMAQQDANARAAKKARRENRATGDADSEISMLEWNVAASRWSNVIDVLRRHQGPSLITARLEEVTVMGPGGKPTSEKRMKVKAHKSLPYDVGGIVEMPERGKAFLAGVRTTRMEMPERRIYPGFSVEKLWRDLGLHETAMGQRRHAHLVAQGGAAEPGEQSTGGGNVRQIPAPARPQEDRRQQSVPARDTAPAAPEVDDTAVFAAKVAARAAVEANVDTLRATYQGLKAERPRVLDVDVQDAVTAEWLATTGVQHDGALTLGTWLMTAGRWVKANGRAIAAPSPVVEDGDGPEDPWALPATDADLPPEARAAAAVLDARTVDDLDRIKTHAGPALLAVDITWAVSDATAAALRLQHGAIELGDLIAAARRHLTAGDGTTVREAVALAAQN